MDVHMKYGWVTSTCGLGYLGDFFDRSWKNSDTIAMVEKNHGMSFEKWCEGQTNYALGKAEVQGTGYLCVGYINTALCAKVQEFLDVRYKTVFVSEKRLNKNSDNEFWFVIYDAKVKLDGSS